jgi:FkbM family methyltransferase
MWRPLSHARNKPFVSSAQNFEDAVLWRVLKDVDAGRYVDVGAFDPVIDSISWSYYERGWQGVVIEPVPAHAAALRERRPRDVTIEAAAGSSSGTATLFVAGQTANSTLERGIADRIAATGVGFSEVDVRVEPLDGLLADAGLNGHTIHFCSIDVEGREADVLSGFDLSRWRPWILVIEATEPNRPRSSHEAWEPGVLDAGYQFCLFDGLNRFYVHPDKAEAFAQQLSFPACVFDESFHRAVAAARRTDELERIASEASLRTDELERIASEASLRTDELERIASEASLRTDELERIASEASLRTDELERIASEASRRMDELEQMALEASRRATDLERVASRAIRRAGELEKTAARVKATERENSALAARAGEAEAELVAMKATVSWRVTRPLRAVRGAQRSLGPRRASATGQPLDGRQAGVDRNLASALARRFVQATETLLPDEELGSRHNVEEALDAFEEALTSSTAPDRAKAWLSLVAVDGAFPGERSVEHFARMLRMEGAGQVCEELRDRFAHSVAHGRAAVGELDVRRNEVIVDVTHTAMASDLHTGIQRVVRETVARWINTGRPMDLIRFDLRLPTARILSTEERERFESWRAYVGSADSGLSVRESGAEDTVVPWQCDVVVPELPFEAARTEAYRGLGVSSVLRSLSLVGYDVIPIVAAEKVVPQVTTDFGGYLSVVKHADRVSTISRTSRDSFKAFATMAAAEGLHTPIIEALELPAEAPRSDVATVAAARSQLGLGTDPAIVVVGSHEPRKNHLVVLEAAERLWGQGHTFELLFLGWSGWLGEEFDHLVGRLVAAGRPIIVRRRCSEDQLWAAYRLARFTVFPSLMEGFGLPIAESLASGTPVITSNYGSMAEVAEKGGCLVVDPRNVDELERGMALLLEDDDTLEQLRAEASRVDTGTWERYASQLWDFFTEEFPEAQVDIAP